MAETRIQVNKTYIPFLVKDKPRTQIFFGGASSGKSVFLSQRAVLDVLRGGRNYLVVRNVAKTLRASAFTEIVKIIKEAGFAPFFKINKGGMVITCFNGYQILFAGLDDVEKLKSITPEKGVLTDIWLEEATEMYENDVKQLYKRLRGTSTHYKRVTLSFNPILKTHWIYKRYFSSWTDSSTKLEDPDVCILKTTYKNNNFLTQDDIEALEAETDKYYYEVYTLGNWGILGAVIFKNYRIEDLSKKKAGFSNLRFGLDFGFSGNPSALSCCHYDAQNKKIYIYDELYQTDLTNDLLTIEVMKKTGKRMITADSEDPKSIQELRNRGLFIRGAKKGPDSKIYGIQWLQQHEIIIDVKCINAKTEFEMYKWKEDRYGNSLPIPVDKNDHLIDSLRYAFEDDMNAGNRIRTLSKRRVGII